MMNLAQAAAAIGGQARGADVRFTGVFSDTRKIEAGGLFVALRGERFDGHQFARDALKQGAVAAMVERAWADTQCDELPLLVVDECRLALGRLAAYWRGCFAIPLIGVTGSNGKTTVKEMCAAILRAYFGSDAVLATQGNLNNDIGLPLTLLGLRDMHRAAVIEMGMNHAGEISYLTRIARPTVAIVNNAQRAHLAGLGTLADVARAKGEIFEGLDQDGVAVINADDAHADVWRALNVGRRIIHFGLEQAAEVRADLQASGEGVAMKLDTPAGAAELQLPVPGVHNACNALAATAAALAVNLPLPTIVAALAGYQGAKGRLQRKAALGGALLIDDSYNANPDSMRAAIDVLASLPGKRIFVMGDMGEVGAAAGQFHSELGGYAKSMGVERLLCLGDMSASAAYEFGSGAEHFSRIEDLIATLKRELDAATTVLVKGSRFMRMERVAQAIEQQINKGEGHAA